MGLHDQALRRHSAEVTPVNIDAARSMRELAAQAVQRTGWWSVEDLDWSALRPERLADSDRSVVRFITFIEDHIPGYLSYVLDVFPVNDDVDIARFCVNREYFRFLIAWANDEERHASVLTRYQVEAGMNTPDDLMVELAEEGRKQISLPYEHPLQAFTYTLVQEKATQLFYQRFRQVVTEPVLRDLLSRLARDEARHFAFYASLVRDYIERSGLAATVPAMKDVLGTFRMPLADTLSGYWRWSLQVADTAGYDHTEAYEALVRLVNGFSSTRGETSGEDLQTFVDELRRI